MKNLDHGELTPFSEALIEGISTLKLMERGVICCNCHCSIMSHWKFCPNCGRKIESKRQDTFLDNSENCQGDFNPDL